MSRALRSEFTEIIPASILATKVINNNNDCVNIHGAALANARRESAQRSPEERLIYAMRSRDIRQYQFSAAVPRFSPRSTSRIVTFLQIYNRAINIQRELPRENVALWEHGTCARFFNVESRALMYLNPKQESQNSHITECFLSEINLPSKDQVSTREKPSVNGFDDFLAV